MSKAYEFNQSNCITVQKARIKDLEKENEQLKSENIELTVDNKELKCTNNELYKENEQLKQTNQRLNDELQDCMGKLALKR